jgi:glutathione S-transferase
MIELYQAEWCPESRRIRQRLTELAIDYTIRQVPVDKTDRTALVVKTGTDTIPALVTDDRQVITTEDAIRAWLDQHYPEPDSADAHRAKAAKARRRDFERARVEFASAGQPAAPLPAAS